MIATYLRYLLLYFIWLAPFIVQAQNKWICGDDKFIEIEKKSIPNYEQRLFKHNVDLQQYTRLSGSSLKGHVLQDQRNARGEDDSIYTIPVVVHVVHPAGEPYGVG